MTVFSRSQRARMVEALAGPDLLVVVQALGLHLPPLLSPEDVVRFVSRHALTLNTLLWEGYRALAGIDAHPLDGYPPRQGPVARGMSLEAVEESIAQEETEYVVLFDGAGRQVARFGPAGTRAGGLDPHGLTLLDPMLLDRQAGAQDWRMTHNHPACGTLSNLDLVLAVRLNLAEIRAVCRSAVWWCVRPERGWPPWPSMQALCRAATEQAQEDLYERHINAFEEENTDTDTFNHAFADAFHHAATRHGFPALALGHATRPWRTAPHGPAARR